MEEGVQSGTDRTSGVEHVVHEDYDFSRDREADLRLLHHGFGTEGGKIVAVERDIEGTHGDGGLLNTPDHLGQALGKGISPPAAAYEAEVAHAIVFFDNLMGQTHQCALDFGGRHQLALFADV